MPRLFRGKFTSKKRKRVSSKGRPFKRRQPFKRRRPAKRRRMSKKKQIARGFKIDNLMAKQHYTIPYMDLVESRGTTNQAAVQTMWGVQQTPAEGKGATLASGFTNLCMYDGQILQPAFYAASQQDPQVIVSTRNTLKMLINNYHTSMRIKNVSSGEIEFVHYRVRARKDFLAPSSSLSSVTSAITNQNATNTNTTTGNVLTTSTTYGAEVFDLPNLCTFVKVVKKYQPRFLKPNQAINLGYRSKGAKIVKWNDYSQPSTTSST